VDDRTLFRLGSWAAIIGGVVAIVTNILHPRPENFDDPIAEQLRLLAESDSWVAIHLGLLAGFLLIVFGLFALARSMKGGPGEGIARVALGSLLISTPVAVFGLMLETYTMPAISDAGGGAAATAVGHLGWAAFMYVATLALGVTPVLFGLAITRDGGYPAWLGWVAFLFGLVSIGAGVTGLLDGDSSGFQLVFAISSGILTLWVIAVGVLLGRRAAGPVTVPEGARPRTTVAGR
jgi:hypothetical protein